MTPPADRRVCRDTALPGQKCSWPYSDCAHREAIARAAVEARDRQIAEQVRALHGVTLLVEKATGFGGSVIERAAVLRLLGAG